MCGHKIRLLMRYRGPDTWDGEKIVPGTDVDKKRSAHLDRTANIDSSEMLPGEQA